jgi:hypothetical protein
MRWMARLSLLFWFTTLSSLALMVVTLYYQPSLSYFLTSSRAWELSAGALVAIAVRADKSALNFIKSRIFQYLPFPLLIVSLILVRAENFGYTMPLVIFASIILVSKPTDSTDLDVKLLSGKAIRFMGNISYSLYLWHWPVITFGTELGYADSLLEKLALAALSLALAILSYYFIELKAQKIDMSKFLSDKSVRLPRALRIGTSIALLLAVLVIPSAYAQPSVQSYVASHFKAPETDSTPSLTPTPTNTAEVEEGDWLARRQTEIRNSNSAIAAAGKLSDKQISEINRVSDGDSYATGFDFTCSWGECTLGSPNAKTRILLIGDSHALMYQSTLSYLNRIGTDLFVKSIIQAECANVSGSRSLSKLLEEPKVAKCEKHHQTVLSHVNSITTKYDWVVLSDSTIFEPKHYVQDALDFANRVKVAGKETIVLGQAPVNKDLSICLDKDYSNYTDCSGSKPSSLHDYQVAKEAKVGYADLGALFCLQNYCPLIIGDSPTMSRGHITDVAGIQLAPYFMEMLNDSKIPVK